MQRLLDLYNGRLLTKQQVWDQLCIGHPLHLILIYISSHLKCEVSATTVVAWDCGLSDFFLSLALTAEEET